MKDEVQLQAMARHGILSDVDRSSVLVVTLEHVAPANSPMTNFAGTHSANDNCLVRAVIIGTGAMQAAHR